jgi:Predicted membrane protein (DUF2085)
MRCVVDRRTSRPWLWRLFCAGAVGWAALIPSAALAAGRAAGAPVVGLLAALPYAVGAVICHQQAARSFAIWSQQLPVCARCTGIYAGAAMIAMAATLGRAHRLRQGFGAQEALRHNNQRKVAQRFSAARPLAFAALPTLATLAYEWSTNTTPSNVVRAIAGFPLGAAVAWVILSAVDDQVN